MHKIWCALDRAFQSRAAARRAQLAPQRRGPHSLSHGHFTRCLPSVGIALFQKTSFMNAAVWHCRTAEIGTTEVGMAEVGMAEVSAT